MPVIGVTNEYSLFTTSPYEGAAYNTTALKRSVNVRQWSSYSGNRKDPVPQTFLVDKTNAYYGSIQGYRYKSNTIQSQISNGYISSPPALPTTLSAPFSELSDTNFKKILQKMQGGLNYAVDLLEGGQTIKMMRSVFNLRRTLKDFTRALIEDSSKSWSRYEDQLHRRGLRPGKNRGSRPLKPIRRPKGHKDGQSVDYATGKWLEYQYGWKPFVSSIYETIEVLDKYSANRFIKGKSRSSCVKASNGEAGTGTMSDPFVVWGTVSQYRVETVANFRLPPNLNISNFTSLNPLSIAWELVPYSFVIDWVIHVGDYLEAWENWARYAAYFAGGYETRSFKTTYSVRFTGSRTYPISYWPNGSPVDGPTREFMYGASNGNTSSYKDRKILYALPFPEAGIKISVELNSKRLLDAASLLWGAIRR